MHRARPNAFHGDEFLTTNRRGIRKNHEPKNRFTLEKEIESRAALASIAGRERRPESLVNKGWGTKRFMQVR